jgi:hypothetical protein
LSKDLHLEQTFEPSQWHVARAGKSGNSFTGIVSACVELIQLLSNYPGLSAFQQIDFTERDLIPPTCLRIRFDPHYLVRPNLPVLIDPRQLTQGEKKGEASSSGSIDKSLCTQKHHG